MSSAAITVEHLSKAYRIGQKEEVHDTLAGAMLSWAKVPLRNFRKLRRLSSFDLSGGSEETDVLWSLRDVSFEVQPGEVMGIIGRNGAGKSTLLKVLSRITRPTSGRAVIRGRVSSLLEVGTGFHPELTGRENIYMNGTILGMRKREIDRKFDEIVEFSSVEKFLDTPVKRYSSGMKVRLAFAVAAHLEPEILIIDEVLAVGDFEFQKKCLGKMNDVATSGRTVLFVSHNMAAVSSLCESALLLSQGTVVTYGEVSSVIEKYLSDAAAGHDGEIDLSWHPARRPGTVPIIVGVRLCADRDGPSTSTFLPMSRLCAEIRIDPPHPIRNARVAVAIEDVLSRRITTVAAFLTPTGEINLRGPCRVLCEIPSLRLGSGSYLLSFSVGTKDSGLLDSLDGAVRFDVDWNDVFQNGERHHPSYGPVLSESSWEVIEA